MSKVNKTIKVYVVGGGQSHASWLKHEIVNNMEDADLVLFTGGEDIDPSRYKQNAGRFTCFDKERDAFEFEEADKAVKLGKNIFGICRGAQLGCVYSGGSLVQHMNHPHQHNITLWDGTTIATNSVHHQLQKPMNLHSIEYMIAGWAKGLSTVYLNGDNRDCLLPSVSSSNKSYHKEPELVYYRRNKWLGIQGHPEWMPYNADMPTLMRAMVDLMVDNQLDIVLTLDIPTSRFIGKDLELFDDELNRYEYILSVRKQVDLDLATS